MQEDPHIEMGKTLIQKFWINSEIIKTTKFSKISLFKLKNDRLSEDYDGN